MPELIERGHIYIGLPPLYKVKQGKNELYLKDDAALNAYLVSNAIDGAELRPADGAPPLDAGLGRASYALRIVPAIEGQGGALQIEKKHHGLASVQLLSAAQLLHGELRQLIDVAAQLDGLLQPGATVSRGGRTQAIVSFREAQDWLMEEAKKGRAIQRFKGLGEMNPEQLWDTTVNPETRRLLKVRIEDAVAADQIFSTLMGDVVEPRRDFIEENALRVGNLDV
jgi:DNA gyrase subunit B